MNRRQALASGVCLLSAAAVRTAWAKRGPPAPVAPLKHQGVEYRVNHDQMGCVEAVDPASGDLFWRRQVYVVRYDLQLERDVQDVYIARLEFHGPLLLVANERQSIYHLNPQSLEVHVVKGSLVEAARVDRSER